MVKRKKSKERAREREIEGLIEVLLTPFSSNCEDEETEREISAYNCLSEGESEDAEGRI